MDRVKVYQCPEGNFIHSFYATPNHVIIAESPKAFPNKVRLNFVNQCNNKSTNILNINIPLSHTRDGTISMVRAMKLVGDVEQYLVVNTGDGVQLVKFPPETSSKLIEKWYVNNNNDSVNSLDAYERKGDIYVTVGTKLGYVISFSFNKSSEVFKIDKSTKYSVSDSVNSVSSNATALVFGSYDNFIYALVNKKLESHICLDPDIQVDNLISEQTLTSVDFATIKKYSSSFIMYFTCHVTNLGCILYKRSVRGEWSLVNILRKYPSSDETSPFLNCCIKIRQELNQLQIFSGSEDGKLYIWKYNYEEDTIVDSKIIQIKDGSLIRNLILTENDRLLFISSNDSQINYIDI